MIVWALLEIGIIIMNTIRVLSHLIRLPDPNPRSIAPPVPSGLCSHYIVCLKIRYTISLLAVCASHAQTVLSNQTTIANKFGSVPFRDLVRLRFISAMNHTGVHMNHTPGYPFYADSSTVCKCTLEFGKTVITSSKRTEIWRQVKPCAHEKC